MALFINIFELVLMSIDENSGFGRSFGDQTLVSEIKSELRSLYAVQLTSNNLDGLDANAFGQSESFCVVAVNVRNNKGKKVK
jgi:hypothetical protein